MAQEDTIDSRAAVYAPWKTFLTSLETLDQGCPPKLHPSVWQSFSGGTQGQLWSAYKFLGLIDGDGTVTAILHEIVDRSDVRNDLLRDILYQRYEKVVAEAEKKSSQADFESAMRQYNVQGETLEKAIRFYLQAAEALGLPVSPHWKKKAGAPGGAKRSRSKRKGTAGTESGQVQETPPPPPPPPSGDTLSIELKSGGQMVLTVTASLTALSREDREFAFDIIDKMNDYVATQRQPRATVDGREVTAVVEKA